MIFDAPHHAGDRVMYDGREYRAVHVDWRYHNADLLATDGSGDFLASVHLSHLEMSWCPKSHGGSGPPVPAAEASA